MGDYMGSPFQTYAEKRFNLEHRHFKFMERAIVALCIIKGAHPELRVTQILINALGTSDLFYTEDDTLAWALEEYCKNMSTGQ
jgi:hypothetical protein